MQKYKVIGKWQSTTGNVKRASWLFLIAFFLLPIVFIACKESKNNQPTQQAAALETYTCPMHPQIIKDKPGSCPICGMDLVKKTAAGEKVNDVTLNDLLRPSNQYVLSSIPTVHIQERDEPVVDRRALEHHEGRDDAHDDEPDQHGRPLRWGVGLSLLVGHPVYPPLRAYRVMRRLPFADSALDERRRGASCTANTTSRACSRS